MRFAGPRALIGALVVLAIGAAVAVGNDAAAPDPAPPAAGSEQIVAAFTTLTRATDWQLVTKVPLRFDAYHPEGVVRLGDRFVLATVEVTASTPTASMRPSCCGPATTLAR